jgi:murein DD-endopeptidase MepM/ murein hydrolase activator NlpD
MKILKFISHLFFIGLMLTLVGVTGCAQNPRTPNSPPVDLLGNEMLQPAPIYEEPYPMYPIPSVKKPKPTRPTAKAKKTVKSSTVTHTVKFGENLYRIALHYGVSQTAIKSANGLKSNTLKVGQKLRIPGGKVSGTKTTAPVVSSKVTKTVASSVRKTVVVPPKNIASCSPAPKWGLPSQGTVTLTASGIAITISGSAQPVKAAASGTVTYSGQGTQKRPNRITISHNKSFSTVYEYYGTSLAKIGMKVTLGQTIGQLNSQTPLYFEIRCHSKALNPLHHLPG